MRETVPRVRNPTPDSPARQHPSVPVQLLLVVALILFPGFARGMFEQRGPVLSRLGFACTAAADPLHPAARAYNPAGAALRSTWGVSSAFSRSFGLREFDRFRIDATGPAGPANAGVWFSSFGRELYSERAAGVSASTRLLGPVHAGAGISYGQVRVRNYGSDGFWSADLGLFAQVRSVSVGGSVLDVASTPLSDFGEHVPRRKAFLAASWRLDDRISLHLEAPFEQDHPAAIRAGVRARLFEALEVRAGYDSASERLHLGLAVYWRWFAAEGAYDHHPWLGWSEAFGVSWLPERGGSEARR